MKFEISEILPAKDPDEVLDILEAELSEVSDRVARSANQITAGRMRGASLGAINRPDSIFIARANGHQVLLIARLDYRTSFRFKSAWSRAATNLDNRRKLRRRRRQQTLPVRPFTDSPRTRMTLT